MTKNLIQKIINFFGYKISKFKSVDVTDLDGITKILQNTEEPIIFDVGANKGQSIRRYKKIFPNSIIHSFEPNKKEVEKLIVKYKNDNSVVLNNVAVGEKPGNLEFNIIIDREDILKTLKKLKLTNDYYVDVRSTILANNSYLRFKSKDRENF